WSDAGVGRAAIGRARRFETVLRRGNVDIVLEVSASPVQYHGAPASLLLTREVTQRVRVLDALRASEERYRILFENNPQPMWVEDAESGAFLAVNEAAVRHYGWPREKFLTLRSADLRLDPGAGAEQRAGDELLVQIARRLESCRRAGDTVARLGGDEFTLLVEGVSTDEEAIAVSERVHRALAPPYLIEGHEVFAGASIGIALGGPV